MPNDDELAKDDDFGRALRARYEAAGFTRRSFAEAIGVKYNSLWRYESGRQSPSKRVLREMERVLGLRPGELSQTDLFGGTEFAPELGAPPRHLRDDPERIRTLAHGYRERADQEFSVDLWGVRSLAGSVLTAPVVTSAQEFMRAYERLEAATAERQRLSRLEPPAAREALLQADESLRIAHHHATGAALGFLSWASIYGLGLRDEPPATDDESTTTD